MIRYYPPNKNFRYRKQPDLKTVDLDGLKTNLTDFHELIKESDYTTKTIKNNDIITQINEVFELCDKISEFHKFNKEII